MTKTIILDGGEVSVVLDGAHAHIRNDSTDVIYAAKTAGISPGADGVASIPAGQADTLRGISGVIYLLGTGSAHIQSDDYVANPFKTSAQGGSGADEAARAAISTHSGNAEIHVTAEEKWAWSGKAELSDIPTTLPANGGNADTVGGKSAADIMAMECNYNYRTQISKNTDLNELTRDGRYAVPDGSTAALLSNTPFLSSGFYLDVYKRNDTLITQTAMTWTGIIKIRNHSETGTWGDWQNLVRSSDIASLEARIAALEAK